MNQTARPSSPYRWVIVIGGLVIVLLAIVRFVLPGRISPSSELKRFNTVPPFALTERSGRTITNADLTGKIWVADFIYTTCPGPCPLVSASLARVAQATEKDPRIQLVTFTVDPQTDTPALLATYAEQLRADKDRWWFLTGAEKPMYDLIKNGFYQVVVDNRGQPLEPGQFTITHSTYFALVDGNGDVRGFFDGVSKDGRADLLKAIKTLEKESP